MLTLNNMRKTNEVQHEFMQMQGKATNKMNQTRMK